MENLKRIKSYLYTLKVNAFFRSTIYIQKRFQKVVSYKMSEFPPVDIKILWWIHNRPIVHGKIFAIKLIFNWWRGQSANEMKPHGKIKWRKPYGSVRRKDLYGKFLLNKILN